MMYKLNGFGVIRLSDSTFIPQDDSNPDWVRYQEWLNSGNQALPEDAPPAVAGLSISRFQAKAVLLRHGFLDEVESYATSPTTEPLVRLAWDEAVEVKRSSLMVMTIAILLDLSPSQLDNLFAEAATIEV